MASASSSISSSEMRQLNLSLEEMNLPPWSQMLNNGALDPNRVKISNPSCTSTKVEDLELDGYFSDEDNSATAVKNCESDKLPELKLREYQKELAESALRGENTIICAPTGSGKTRVATYIILEHLKQSNSDRKRKVAFFAKTVPLAVQQYKALCRYLPSYEITLVTGQADEPLSLHMFLHHNDIIVMTPQILENHLKRNYLPSVGVFSMLVFDECHHTVKNDPYKILMMSYLKMKDKLCQANAIGEASDIKLPQILGLTATIGVGKAADLDAAINNIMLVCATLDVVSLSTVKRNIDELKEIVPVPEEKFRKLTERDNDESVGEIHKIMKSLEDQLKHLARELNDNGFSMSESVPEDRKSQTYEQWAIVTKTKATEVAIRDPDRETNIPVRLSIIILEYLIRYRVALETYDLVELKDVIGYLDRCFHEFSHEESTVGETRFYTLFQELKMIILTRHGEENPNLRILTETLMKYLVGKGEASRGIIFVRTLALADALSKWLQRCDIEAVQNLNACKFTGSNVPEEQGGTSQAHQEDILRRFKSGEVRLLVATSVAEEGLDITECNLVIKYNHVGTEVTSVQTRGRCRQFGGVSVLLAMNKILRREQINYFREKLMREAIENIAEMDPIEFGKRIEKHQTTLIQEAYLAELLQNRRVEELENVSFRMVCAWCRKVAVDGSNVKKVECHHVSIDRNFLDNILVIPEKNAKQIDDCLFLGTVICRGEPETGRLCKKKLGRVMKYRQIPYVALNIKCFAFDFGSQGSLETYKKWIETGFSIKDLSFDDTLGYIQDRKVLAPPRPELDKDDSSDESSCDTD